MREAVYKAVAMIHRRFSESITLEDIANEVFVSPFHLSRVFAQEVGVPPGRYLTAVRMFEAKKLLISSPMNVCDIVHSVGYNSVGTFTSRFTRAVGMTPRQYRHPDVERLLVTASGGFSRMPCTHELEGLGPTPVSGRPGTGTLSGTVELPRSANGTNVLVGAFHSRIPQQAPVAHRFLPSGPRVDFTLTDVPVGSWTIVALAMRTGISYGRENVFVGVSPARVGVSPGDEARTHLSMRRLAPTDAPIAVTLADTSPLPVDSPALVCG
ncbi:helix-turn-helix transcriptional regulator [Nocardiopsis sp. NPDC049922]|uniref:helix-turn-helix transcriptional regulator n=1 Tax=Nocardiopsis sp. NPDC049922 TaxID=3155157 RepID=UPI0033DAB8BE